MTAPADTPSLSAAFLVRDARAFALEQFPTRELAEQSSGWLMADLIEQLERDLAAATARAEAAEREYDAGFLAGITAYAWHKDGLQWVGTTGKTLHEAQAHYRKTWNYAPPLTARGKP